MSQRLNKAPTTAEFYNLSERCLNSGDNYWGNLGYWSHCRLKNSMTVSSLTEDDYTIACTALAHKLAQAVELHPGCSLLDIGFGCGDQLLLWLQHYQVAGVAGINYSHSQTELAKLRLLQAGFPIAVNNVRQGSVAELSAAGQLATQDINRVLALDCACHFPSRQQFFHDSYQHLTAHSNSNSSFLGLTDIVLATENLPRSRRWVLNIMLKLSRIPRSNIVTLQQYHKQLQEVGFQQITIEDISKDVFVPFGQWIKAFKHSIKNKKGAWLKYHVTASFLAWAHKKNVLRYVVVSAKV